ncbi:MAG: DUF5686 family protein [Fermentimonas sp.]|nr:DUF5686 family protein [Fermentimonas sp.]
MMTRKTILFILTIVLSSALNGQNILFKGRVLDAEYLTPVPYAAVYIHNTPNGTIADNVGEFSFEAPVSLKNEILVVARQKYDIQYIKLEEQLVSEMVIFLKPDNFALRSKELQDSLNARSNNFTSTLSKVAGFIKDDWIPLGNPQTNRFDFGRIQTLPTYNVIEGLRLRAGVASNSRLSPNFFMNSYVAYGFGDQRWKYRGELTYSFDKKSYHENEFPKNKIALVYENDLYSPGEMHPRSPNNLLLITFRRSENEATYRNFAEVNYEREYKNGLAHTLWLRRSRLTPQGSLRFDHQINNVILSDDELIKSEAGVLLRYSFNEAYEQKKRRRNPIELTSPVFFLSHSVGAYVQFGKSHTYHRSEFSAQKRFLLGNVGRLDAAGEVMKVWNSVPFPLLVYPNQRQRHHIENNAFFLKRALEFVADEQYTLRFTFVGDDLLLAKIPIMNQLQIRELISLRASHGRLSDKNRPGNTELYDFPDRSFEYESVPYIAGAVGFTNILGILRVEYVHRFTYRHHPDALLGKIRVDVTL